MTSTLGQLIPLYNLNGEYLEASLHFLQGSMVPMIARKRFYAQNWPRNDIKTIAQLQYC